MTNGFLKQALIVSFTMLFIQTCIGQNRAVNEKSFIRLHDEIVKKEIALFTIQGSSTVKADSLCKIKLQKIPLKKCSDEFAFFEKGNIYDNEIMIDIASEKQNSETKIKEIRLLYGRYELLILPDSAITGIYDLKFCEKYTKKGRPVESNCKAFRSEDKRRVYIYMINGRGENRYEVTWVIQDSKYYTRVIDPI